MRRGVGVLFLCVCAATARADFPTDGGAPDARSDDQRQLDTMLPKLEECFRGNVGYIYLNARMTVQLAIAADGKVRRARLLKSSVGMPAYHAQCVMTALGKARLAPGGVRAVTHELVWRHPRPEPPEPEAP